MKQFDAQVLENVVVAKDYWEMTVTWPEGVRVPAPGQILSVRVNAATVPFLRRPFAVASFDAAQRRASIIYHVRGPGTEILAHVKPGEFLDIVGPRGFYFRPGTERQALMVGGGVGTGPMVYAANWLAARDYTPRLVLGYRSGDQVPQLKLHPAVRLQICTDDGSAGHRGNVVQFLNALPAQERVDTFVWACGPHGMLKALHYWCQPQGIPCHVSMEEIMACGVGACAGCTLETTDARGVVRVCTEGPVLPSEVIKWT